jgi:hypothetical protein
MAVQLPLAFSAASLAVAHRRKKQFEEHKQGWIAEFWVSQH